MQLRQLSRLVIGAVGLMGSSLAYTLGLGEVTVNSSFNEPLNAEIRLLQPQGLSEEEILVRLASNEDFARIGIDREFFLTNLTFTVVLDNPNKPHIRVTSSQPVQEPYLNFLLDAQWPSGRLLREYTLLLDLPVFAEDTPAPVVTPAAPAQPVTPTPPVVEAPPVVERPIVQAPIVEPTPSVSPERLTSPDTQPDTSTVTRSQIPAPQFETAQDAADDFLKKLSQQAAERKSSFGVQSAPEASPSEPKPVVRSTAPSTPKKQPIERVIRTESKPSAPVPEQVAIEEKPVQQKQAPQAPAVTAPATPATATSSPKGEHQIQSGDTLWSIATQLRPNSSVSVQQTMMALKAANPDAFIDDNINLLRKGQVLRAPTLSEIEENSFRQAVAAVKQQNQAWVQRNQSRAEQANQKATLSASAAPVAQPTGPKEEKGRVTLASADSADTSSAVKGSGSSGQGESLENELAIAKEELDKASRENTNLKTRISELEDQIKTLEGLVQLTNDQLKALEVATATNNEASTEAAETTSTSPVPVPAEPQAQAEQAVTANEPAQAPIANSPQPSVVDSIIGFIMKHLALIGAAILVLLLAILFLLRRNKKEDIDDDFEDDFSLSSDLPPIEDEFDIETEELASDEELYDLDELDDGEEMAEATSVAKTEDPVAEADIYIGLGQTEKAEEILQHEIQQNPDNADARVALLKIYSKAQNAEAFDDQYAQLLPLGNVQANSRAKSLREDIPNIGSFDEDSYSLNNEPDFTQSEDLVGDVDDTDLDEELLLDEDELTDLDDFAIDETPADEEPEETEDSDVLLGEDDNFTLTNDDDSNDELVFDEELSLDEDEESLLGDISSAQDEELEDFDSAELDFSDIDLESEPEAETDDIANSLEELDGLADEIDLDIENDVLNEPASSADESLGIGELSIDDDNLLDISDDAESDIGGDIDTDIDSDFELTGDLDLSFDESLLTDIDDGDLEPLSEETPEPAIDEAPEASAESDIEELDLSLTELDTADELDLELLDFDSDIEANDLDADTPDISLEGDADQAIEQGPEILSEAADNSLDTDIEDLAAEIDVDDEPMSVLEDNLEEEPSPLESVEDDGLDLDLDVSDLEENVEPAALDSEDDFDLDLPPQDIDIDSLDKEIDEMAAALDDTSTASPSSDTVDIADDGELSDDDLAFLGDSDEIETKLDLAQAYVDMGDNEGAQDILEEVLEEGNEEQKQSAQKLLDNL